MDKVSKLKSNQDLRANKYKAVRKKTKVTYEAQIYCPKRIGNRNYIKVNELKQAEFIIVWE